MPSQCPHGHVIRDRSDRLPNGYCRECQRQQSRRYRERQRAAMDLAKALETGGLVILGGRAPVTQVIADLVNQRQNTP